MIIIYAILIAIIITILRRQLRVLACYALLLVMLYMLWRIAPDLGLAQRWVLSLYGGVLLSIIIGPWLAYRLIVAWHVNQDRRRAHERVDQEQDRRLP